MGEKQYEQVSPAMIDNPALKEMVERFELEADSEVPSDRGPGSGGSSSEGGISLSPEIEQFLSDVAEGDGGSDEDESESQRG
jgi:hypothetical protein